MGKKLDKNLSKIQSMVDGTFGGKIQSGYVANNVHANREIGERYFDHDGKEWECKGDNYRVSVNKLPRTDVSVRSIFLERIE